MKLEPTDLRTLHDRAVSAARAAGELIQSKVGEHRETNTKEGGNTLASQVVTEVDLESEALILKMLSAATVEFDLGILTEEQEDDSSRHGKDFFWCIDPIDGTLPFIECRPGYSVSIALVSRTGEPVLGVVLDPVKDELFHAWRGGGARKNGKEIHPTATRDGRTLRWMMDRSMKSVTDYEGVVEAVERMAKDFGCDGVEMIDHAGAALNGCWITESHPAVYFKLPKKEKGGGSLWDFAASACVLNEWQGEGVPSDISGNPLDLNPPGCTFMNRPGILYTSSQSLREAVIELANPFRDNPVSRR